MLGHSAGYSWDISLEASSLRKLYNLTMEESRRVKQRSSYSDFTKLINSALRDGTDQSKL